MNQVAGFDRDDAMPHAAGHNTRIASTKGDNGFGTNLIGVTVIDDQLHRATDDVKELVTVGMHLAEMRTRPSAHVDSSDGVPIDSLWRSGCHFDEAHRVIAAQQRDLGVKTPSVHVRYRGHR